MMNKAKDRKSDDASLMKGALEFFRDRPDMYVGAFGTNRIVRMTYIWKLRVERGLEDKR